MPTHPLPAVPVLSCCPGLLDSLVAPCLPSVQGGSVLSFWAPLPSFPSAQRVSTKYLYAHPLSDSRTQKAVMDHGTEHQATVLLSVGCMVVKYEVQSTGCDWVRGARQSCFGCTPAGARECKGMSQVPPRTAEMYKYSLNNKTPAKAITTATDRTPHVSYAACTS
jgi:hypothetical protein